MGNGPHALDVYRSKMSELKFIPQAAQGDGKILEGHVVLKKPSFIERYEALEIAGFDAEAKSENQGAIGVVGSKLKALRLLVQESKKFYVSVDLKVVETGEEIKTVDEMFTCPECDSVLIEVAKNIMTGFSVGKPLKQS